MSIKKIWGTRSKTANAATYVGDAGTLFYDETDGELRLSNGTTPGGTAIAVRADLIVAQRLTPAADNNNAYGLGDETHRWWDLHIGDGGIHYNSFADPQTVPYRPGAQVDDIIPALDNNINLGDTDKRFANIYLGYDGLFLADQTTDANINITVDNGTLYVNGAANLAIGNLVIEDTTLKSLTTNLDINIGETNDTGFFYVKRKAQFDNVSFSSTEAMVSLNASGGADPTTVFPDTVMQTVGRPNKNSRIVQRSYGSTGNVGGDNAYSVWASYVARGTVAAPVALKANDILARVSANGYGTTTWGSGGARMEFVALENFTDTAKGTRINFWTTPVGQIASQNVASINSVGVIAAGIEFSGDSTVQTTAGIPLTQKAILGAAYVATLGVDGKLDATQIPNSLTGAIVFKGVWNATTNTPALSNSTPAGLSTGWEYIVEVGGTRDIGDGSKTFLAGDFVIYDGTHWKRVPSGNAFISLTGGGGITVNQSTGAITLGSTATPLSNVSTIVSRDSSGNFAANVITANLTGAVTGTVSGNAGTVTNGVYTTGSQSIDGVKTFTSTIQGNISGSAGSVANGVVTTGSYSDPSWLTLSKGKVGLGNVDNTADANKNVLYATTAGGAPATDVYAWAKAATKPTYTATDVGLGNVTNESKATMFTSPTFTGTVAGVTATMVGLGNVTNESKATMFTSPTFTGTVAGVTKAMVGLGSVENTALSTSTYYIGTTQNTYNRASAAQTLTGVSISGNAGTVTNGVYTTDTGTVTNTMLAGSIANNKLSNSTISGVALGSTLNALTAGFGLALESGTTYDGSAAHTISTLHGVTGPVTVSGNAYALDLGAANGLIILNNVSQANYTITISNPVAGKVVRVMCLNMKTGGGATTVTVSGLTAANSSNGVNTFQGNSNGAVAIVEFICTTTATSGVYMNTGGAK